MTRQRKIVLMDTGKGVVFPLSRKKVEASGFTPGKDNPLSFLHPHEVAAAEIFVMAQGDPRTAATMPHDTKNGKWAVLRSGTFGTQFREMFGFDLYPHHRKGLESNPAWRAYVEQLRTQTRDAVMAKLKADALDAYRDYTWSRTAARAEGDYKETRIAAADHLDRIGASEKPQLTAQNVVVVVRGRNFDEQSLDKELPETSFEVVVPESDVEVI